MKLEQIVSELGLTGLNTAATSVAGAEVTRGYASDLLSDVLANAPGGGVLVTLQVHLNVIAVAGHADLAAVVFAGDRRPDDDVIAKAEEEGLPLYVATGDTFDVVGRLYGLGLRGRGA